MCAYKKGDEKQFFNSIVAALIFISLVIGYFIYSVLTASDDLATIKVENVNGVPYLNPGGGGPFPTSEPNIAQPTVPPPNN